MLILMMHAYNYSIEDSYKTIPNSYVKATEDKTLIIGRHNIIILSLIEGRLNKSNNEDVKLNCTCA